MLNHLKQHFGSHRTGGHGGLDIARHIGPGLLVTVGFIDPGNWASNMAAGSQFGYALLWIVTLSTIMLIVLQHNAAHLGIATGSCLAEATTRYLPRFVGRTVLASAYLATIATAMAEVLGGAIALQMLFGLPVRAGCVIVAAASMAMLLQACRALDYRLRWHSGPIVFGRARAGQGRLAAGRRKLDHAQYAHRLGRDYRECPGCGRYAPQPLPALRGHPIHALRRPRRAGYRGTSALRALRHALFDGRGLGNQLGHGHPGRNDLLCARHSRRRPRRRSGHALPHLGPGELDHLCGSAAVRGTIEQRDSGHGGGNHHRRHVR